MTSLVPRRCAGDAGRCGGLLIPLEPHDRRAVWGVSKLLEEATGPTDADTAAAFRAAAAALAAAIHGTDANSTPQSSPQAG